jgi:hypothetical protein
MAAFVLPAASASCAGAPERVVAGPDLFNSRVVPYQLFSGSLRVVVAAWLLVTLMLPALGLVVNVFERRLNSRLTNLWPQASGCAGVLVVAAVFVSLAHSELLLGDGPCVHGVRCIYLAAGPGLWSEGALFVATAAIGLALAPSIWAYTWILTCLATVLPADQRRRYVAEAQGNIGDCDCWLQRVGYLAGLIRGVRQLARMMRHEDRQGRP